jgi:hypothetical protein
MKEFLITLAAGGGGGAVSWVYSLVLGKPLPFGTPAAIGASIILGMTAAVIGVFLANTDRKNLAHLLGFAVLCGVFWKPVLEAGQAYLGRLENFKAEREAPAAEQTLTQELKTLQSQPPTPATIQKTQAAVQQLAALIPKIEDQKKKQDYLLQTLTAVQAIGDAGKTEPVASIAAVSSIGKAAAAAQDHTVATIAAETLARDMQLADPQHRKLAAKATRELIVETQKTSPAAARSLELRERK